MLICRIGELLDKKRSFRERFGSYSWSRHVAWSLVFQECNTTGVWIDPTQTWEQVFVLSDRMITLNFGSVAVMSCFQLQSWCWLIFRSWVLVLLCGEFFCYFLNCLFAIKSKSSSLCLLPWCHQMSIVCSMWCQLVICFGFNLSSV